mmetsp:Transcript_25550/g.59357  ORF Transcript_25550/g.59357 Transcript_25550/m.59357 type:complete len:119 (-) Transcript_25550:470-826(-)
MWARWTTDPDRPVPDECELLRISPNSSTGTFRHRQHHPSLAFGAHLLLFYFAQGGDWRNLTIEGEITFQVLPSLLRIQFDGENPKRPRADSPGGFKELYTSHIEVTVRLSCEEWRTKS